MVKKKAQVFINVKSWIQFIVVISLMINAVELEFGKINI